jgi:Uma2 family endonuclease
MLQATVTRISPEAFHEFLCQPENAGRHFELINGKIIEKMVAHPYPARVTMRIGGVLEGWLIRHDIGFLTSAEGGYIVGESRCIPDIGFISYARLGELTDVDGYIPVAPDLVVEVISPTDSARRVYDKIVNYLAAGTMVWAVYPDEREISVYMPGKPVRTLTIDDTLDGGAVLPGFSVAIKDLFPAVKQPTPSA